MITGLKWFYNGYRNYGKNGYERKKREIFREEDLNVDISEKRFLITGANSGIGYACSMELAKRGGIVYLVCRSKEKGEKALNEIIKESKQSPDRIHLITCDISLKEECNRLINEFSERKEPIDVLIHNAGVMMSERKLTKESIEVTFATNLLAPFLLTQKWINLMKSLKSNNNNNNNEKPRCIFVSSGGMLTQKLAIDNYQFENLNKWDPLSTYSQTKRAEIHLCEEFSDRYSEDFNFFSMHPGWSSTPQLESAMPTFNWLTRNQQRTPEQGADTIVWLSISPTVESNHSSLFFQDRSPVDKFIHNSNTECSKSDKDKLWKYLLNF
ncbi:hypothetical protein DLAC_08454 [Tieghemostelium lacteum]|uniref:Short-chain dehydrogenase/reductase (SDR) family protein n=1 Tax=Tieghemostelium lacteum TaxID=361077 RepID=A0A151ZC11_TIELA|nr:hypothetical protein DLAC_08454 [Tieghemostelium lacteum]|eukprot:KYQ91486.1 hypothetical protein DLAC_08454 [Tieghemostelium lacteum]